MVLSDYIQKDKICSINIKLTIIKILLISYYLSYLLLASSNIRILSILIVIYLFPNLWLRLNLKKWIISRLSCHRRLLRLGCIGSELSGLGFRGNRWWTCCRLLVFLRCLLGIILIFLARFCVNGGMYLEKNAQLIITNAV